VGWGVGVGPVCVCRGGAQPPLRQCAACCAVGVRSACVGVGGGGASVWGGVWGCVVCKGKGGGMACVRKKQANRRGGGVRGGPGSLKSEVKPQPNAHCHI